MLNSALVYNQFGIPKNVLQLETYSVDSNMNHECLIKMVAAPINPSDLISISGVYSHRIKPPLVAGYEGVGIVIKAKDSSLIGKRVLPMRGEGTWQNYVACHSKWLITVPNHINNDVAARGYINPLAAYLMLKSRDLFDKNIIITAAGSSCANILAQWAIKFGAKSVIGVYRSINHTTVLKNFGVIPVSIFDHKTIIQYATDADYVFDAVGGDLATLLLSSLSKKCQFISYGLLSNRSYDIDPKGIIPIRFHIRDHLPSITTEKWQYYFKEIWDLLMSTQLPETSHFDFVNWRQALELFEESGRKKPLLIFSS